jgi:chemotaxis signal transduction protein
MHPIDEGLVRLRREFDETFARLPEAQAGREGFLGLGLRGDPYALRMEQIQGVLTDRTIVPLPTAVASFAGLTAHRGALVPVYDLGMLLGYATAAALRWVVTVRTSEALIGLGFDRFDGHYRVVAAGSSTEERPSAGHLSFVSGLPAGRPVIDVLILLDSVLRPENDERMKGATNP